MTISALPTPPNREDSPAEFAAAGDALLGALPQFVSEANETAATINTQATATATNAAAAAASAASASAAPATASSSTTNVTIGTGTKNFTVQAGKNLVVGMFVTIAYNASNYMYGNVISYTGTALSVNVTAVVGAGTYALWSIALSAPVTPLNNSVSGSFSADWFIGSGSGLTGIPFSGLAAQPVQQGGGIGQGTNKVYIGWSPANTLKCTVDGADQGDFVFGNKGGFTPFNAGITTAGAGTYLEQTGKYSKIADLCFCRGRLSWSAHTGAAGAWVIKGLPFAAVGAQSFALGYANPVVFGAGKRPIGFIGNGQNYIDIYLHDEATGASSQLLVPPSGDIPFEFFYGC